MSERERKPINGQSDYGDEIPELSANGPGGISFRARGYRVMDLVAIFTFAILAVMGYVLYQHQQTEAHMSVSITRLTASQLYTACIFTIPQNDRFTEWEAKRSSYCWQSTMELLGEFTADPGIKRNTK